MFENGILAFDPRIVQGTSSTFAARPLLHDAVGDLERALHGLHGVAQGYLFGRSSEAGTSPPSLAGLHKTGAGELRHHAGEQTARHHGLFGDPVGGHQLAAPRIEREVNQYPQRVTPLAREFKLHWSLLPFLSPQEIHRRSIPTNVKAFASTSFILTLIMS